MSRSVVRHPDKLLPCRRCREQGSGWRKPPFPDLSHCICIPWSGRAGRSSRLEFAPTSKRVRRAGCRFVVLGKPATAKRKVGISKLKFSWTYGSPFKKMKILPDLYISARVQHALSGNLGFTPPGIVTLPLENCKIDCFRFAVFKSDVHPNGITSCSIARIFK